MIVDESHVTLPQVRGMFAGDHSRKLTLVEHGFRLPSALDNRPLRFDEWEKRRQAGAVHVGDAGGLRAGALRRRGGRAGDPADRAGRSAAARQAGPRPGARPGRRDQEAGRAQGARAGDDADQAAGGGPEQLLPRGGPALQVAALRAGRHRARAGPARAARGGVRRAGRRQPAARGARPAGGVAGGDPRRRQGRLPAQRARR